MLDVAVIGAGQAGLAMGYWLSQLKNQKEFLLIDKASSVGDVWRQRYDSLVLFTPRSYSSLPGLALEGADHGFPSKDEVAEYLEKYANHFSLPLQLETEVTRIEEVNDAYQIYTNKGTIQAKQVVVATGPFHTPFVPAISQSLSPAIAQFHSSEYKNPAQLQPGNVLIVGGGNSGAQIAVELSETREVHLSVGQKMRYFPLTMLGKSLFWWFDKIGILHADSQSPLGKRIQQSGDPIFGFHLKNLAANQKVDLHLRTVSGSGEKVQFEDHHELKVQNIIWATGFQPVYGWIDIKGLINTDGRPIHHRGITNKKGFYFLGLPWLHKRGSSLLLGVGEDAEYLSRVIDREF